MTKNSILRRFVFVFFFVFSIQLQFLGYVFAGASMPPQPPSVNPHPPVTALEKKAVSLAEIVLKTLLSKPEFATKSRQSASPLYINKNPDCLARTSCWQKDADFVANLGAILSENGKVVQWQHAHVIPWSLNAKLKNSKADTPPQEEIMPPDFPMSPKLKDDEYMVHVYVLYEKSDRWYHLDLILSQDEKGEPVLRYIYTVPMPDLGQQLPEGVVC